MQFVLPKKDEDAANLVILCIGLIIITSIISTIFLFLFSTLIEKGLNAPGLSAYIFLVPLAIFCNSIAYVLGFWLTRREQFGTIAKSNLVSSISGKTVSIGSGIISPSPFGLIFGTITNDATIIAILLKKTIVDVRFFQTSSYERIKFLARRYKKFPQYSAGANLTSTAATQATPFLLAIFFSPIVVGFYAIAYMVILLPSKLIGSSIATIFFQKASSERNRTGSAKIIVGIVHTRLVSIGMFICLMVVIIGPELFSFALGSQWLTAGVYAQILAPWFFVAFISTPLFSIFSVFEKQGASLSFNVLLLITRIIVIVISGILGNPILGMLLLSGTGVIFWSWMNMYLLKTAGVPLQSAFQELIGYLTFGVFVCIPLIIAKFFSVSSGLFLAIGAIVTIIYYSIVIYRDTELKAGLLKIFGTIIHK